MAMNEWNFFDGVLIFWDLNFFKKNLDISQSPYWFSLLSSFWIINTEKVSLRCETKSSVSVFYQKKMFFKVAAWKLQAANECNYLYYGLMFISWKYNRMNKSRLWSKNWVRKTCNVALFLSLSLLNTCSNREMFWILDVTHHIVLIWTIKFSFKQVKQRPLKVCIAWKVVGFLEFHIFTGYKNISMPRVILFIINTFTL